MYVMTSKMYFLLLMFGFVHWSSGASSLVINKYVVSDDDDEPAPPCSVDNPNAEFYPTKSCSNYWQCADGIAYFMSCPDGLEFSPALDVCDEPANAQCTGDGWSTEDPSVVTTPLSSTVVTTTTEAPTTTVPPTTTTPTTTSTTPSTSTTTIVTTVTTPSTTTPFTLWPWTPTWPHHPTTHQPTHYPPPR